MLQGLERTFRDLERTFQILEYKKLRRGFSFNCLTELKKYADGQEEAVEEDVAGCGTKNLVEGFAIKGFELAIGFEMEEKIEEVDEERETQGEGGGEE